MKGTDEYFNKVKSLYEECINRMEPQDHKEMGFLLGMQHARDILVREYHKYTMNELENLFTTSLPTKDIVDIIFDNNFAKGAEEWLDKEKDE